MRVSLGQVVAATRGRILSGDPTSAPMGFSIDSRTIEPGQLFFAIRGQVHDGHEHAEAALARGAHGVVMDDRERAEQLVTRGAVLVVPDTTRALQDLAQHVRRESGVTVAAITGSVGKTTTKELTRLLLAADRPTHASPGNLNNHYGLPLAMLAMPSGTRCCVVEMGISTPGEMDRLVEIAEPDLGLVTLIASAHVGNFPSLSELAEEKMKLPAGSKIALLNADDLEQWRRRSRVSGRLVPFGTVMDATAGVRLVAVQGLGLAGSHVVLEHDGARFDVRLPLAGAHQARNLLAAASIALTLGVLPATIAHAAAQATPGRHRGEVFEVSGATLVDDTYNANPRAMRAALELLLDVPASGRRIFVAGDMLELGAASAEEHRRLGELVADRKVDVLLGVGSEAARAVAAASARGVAAESLPDAAAAGMRLVEMLKPGDVVLVKGSRGVALDRAVAHVLERRRS